MEDFINEFTRKYASNIYNSLEENIINALSIHGYTFNSKIELEDFAKNKCHVCILDGIKYLQVDNKNICCWTDYKMDDIEYNEPLKVSYSYNFSIC